MNKEFNRMQKLAGLLTENMEGTSTDEDMLRDMLKKHDSTYMYSDDPSNYNKGKEQEYNINKLRSKLLPKLEDMLKKHDWTYKMSDDSSNFSKGSRQEDEINKLVDLLGNEGKKLKDKYDPFKKAKEMGMEEGLKRTMRENQNQKSLRKKIREMILAEMNDVDLEDPVAEAKKDKEEDEVENVDIENIDVTDDEMMVNDNTEENLLDLLQKAQNDAKKLGDEELVTQIGNNITFFTRRHVSNTEK